MLPEDGKRRNNRCCAFWITELDHDVTYSSLLGRIDN